MNSIILMIGLLITACSTTGTVESDYDRAHDFSQYKQFSWITPTSNAERNPAIDTVTIDQIQDTIANELKRKEFDWTADSATADFFVAFTIDIHDRIEVYREPALSTDEEDTATLSVWGSEYYDPENIINRYIDGSMRIHVYDAQSRAPVWLGTGNRALDPQELETVDAESIAVSVAAILESFPPK